MHRLPALTYQSVATAACFLAACAQRSVEIVIPPPTCTLRAGDLTCPPVVSVNWHRDNPIPPYSPLLVQAGVWGQVTAEVRVTQAGHVDTVAIRQTSNQILADAVRTTLTRWKFDSFVSAGDPPDVPNDRTSRRSLTVEVLFRAYGCKESDPKVAVLPLRATLLIEIVKCTAVHELDG